MPIAPPSLVLIALCDSARRLAYACMIPAYRFISVNAKPDMAREQGGESECYARI